MEKSVVFVCSGNTCRSPLAEVYFNKCLRELDVDGVIGRSAGLFAVPGAPASDNSRLVAEENGCSLEDFSSNNLTAQMVHDAALILGMTEAHCRKIAAAMPECAGKIRCLLEFARGGDVLDPYGGSVDVYRCCFENMKPALECLAENLKNGNLLI